MQLRGERIVLSGATGQVGLPLALALARENEVVAPARFRDAAARQRLEAAGVRCITADLGAGELDEVPTDASFVLHFAMSRTEEWGRDLRDNAEAVGLLMAHVRPRAFLHCSTTSVYATNDEGGPYAEGDPVGDSHGRTRFLRTYSISKIAAEAVARTGARVHGVPTIIARLNVPYGDNGGWPAAMLSAGRRGIPIEVPTLDRPVRYNPIHEDDIAAMVPRLLACASVPATTVNWGGDDVVSIQEWTAYLTVLTGVAIPLVESSTAGPPAWIDLRRQHELVGRTRVHWKDGMRRMVAARHPDLLPG